MESWFKKNYKTIIVSAFLIPIITVALVSISHVTKWYGISNPFTWAVYLSIGIEIAALSALAAISADMGRKVYFPFGIVTLIQFIGNVYFAYSFININDESFKSWVELVSPFVEFMGVDPTDFVGHKRFLAFFAGGMLPIISLSFLHMLIKFTQENKEKNGVENKEPKEEITVVEAKDIVGEVSRVRLSEEDLAILEKYLNNPPKPNDELIKAAEKYKEHVKPEESPTYEKELDGFDGFVPEQIETSDKIDDAVETTPTPTSTITPTPTLTSTVTVTTEEVIEVLPEIIPIVVPLVETPVYNQELINEIPLPTIEDTPIEIEFTDDEFDYTPEELEEFKDWDVTLMDGLDDEPLSEETQDPLTTEIQNELPTIESEEEKKN